MVTIRTKKMPNRNWVCYATINGYDYSFQATGFNTVQIQMANLIRNLSVSEMVVKEPVISPKTGKQKKENYIGYAISRIDNNPIA